MNTKTILIAVFTAMSVLSFIISVIIKYKEIGNCRKNSIKLFVVGVIFFVSSCVIFYTNMIYINFYFLAFNTVALLLTMVLVSCSRNFMSEFFDGFTDVIFLISLVVIGGSLFSVLLFFIPMDFLNGPYGKEDYNEITCIETSEKIYIAENYSKISSDLISFTTDAPVTALFIEDSEDCNKSSTLLGGKILFYAYKNSKSSKPNKMDLYGEKIKIIIEDESLDKPYYIKKKYRCEYTSIREPQYSSSKTAVVYEIHLRESDLLTVDIAALEE